jgi:quercetin dioxygenase-like cupin family protein
VRAQDAVPKPEYSGHSAAFMRASLVDGAAGAVHTALGLCAIEANGAVDVHVHSFEEFFYVVEGNPTMMLDGHAYELAPGACGVVPVGVAHAWRGAKTGSARWIDMLTPIPRTGGNNPDTFFVDSCPVTEEKLDIRDPRSRHFFRMVDDDITVDKLTVGSRVGAPTVSGGMNTALLLYSGIAVKMLVDQRLGAALGTMFMVEYQPGGVAHLHDHPLEESYYILDGEVEAVADDKTYFLKPGDAFWTGVGCVHAFYNRTNTTVRWLETSSPQPPARHSYRFNRDWDYLAEKLSQGG